MNNALFFTNEIANVLSNSGIPGTAQLYSESVGTRYLFDFIALSAIMYMVSTVSIERGSLFGFYRGLYSLIFSFVLPIILIRPFTNKVCDFYGCIQMPNNMAILIRTISGLVIVGILLLLEIYIEDFIELLLDRDD